MVKRVAEEVILYVLLALAGIACIAVIHLLTVKQKVDDFPNHSEIKKEYLK